MHRAAEYDLIDDTAEEGFRALFQLPDEGADYIGERDRGLRQPGAFVHQLGAEDALEGAHVPPLDAADVLGDGGSAAKDLAVVIAEKQDRGDGGVRILERNQQRAVLADGGDGRVRRAEINPAIERHRSIPDRAAGGRPVPPRAPSPARCRRPVFLAVRARLDQPRASRCTAFSAEELRKRRLEEIAHALDLLDRAELRADQDLLKA
jgi:hypothetical protein